jgi:hypothetical protein
VGEAVEEITEKGLSASHGGLPRVYSPLPFGSLVVRLGYGVWRQRTPPASEAWLSGRREGRLCHGPNAGHCFSWASRQSHSGVDSDQEGLCPFQKRPETGKPPSPVLEPGRRAAAGMGSNRPGLGQRRSAPPGLRVARSEAIP